MTSLGDMSLERTGNKRFFASSHLLNDVICDKTLSKGRRGSPMYPSTFDHTNRGPPASTYPNVCAATSMLPQEIYRCGVAAKWFCPPPSCNAGDRHKHKEACTCISTTATGHHTATRQSCRIWSANTVVGDAKLCCCAVAGPITADRHQKQKTTFQPLQFYSYIKCSTAP